MTLKLHSEEEPAESASPSAPATSTALVAIDQPGPGANPNIDRRYVTAALMLVMVLAAMEMMIASTAMPTIIGDLHGLEHYSWVTSVFLLMSTVSMPLYGRLADAWGRKRVVLWAIAIFCVASVLAASAQTLTQLIIFRGLQGLGAGGIMPVVLTILGDIFTLKERARMQGLFSTVWGTSALAGPYVGAILVDSLGWRSIFYVNVPLGALGFGVLAWKYHDHGKPHSTNLDLPGVGLLAVACTAALALVSGLESMSLGVIVALVMVSATAFVWFVRVELRAENPILPPALIANPAIGPPLIASSLMGIAFFGIDTYVPLYVQGTTGAGPKAAAGVITPIMLAWAASGVFVAPIIVRWGFRRTAITGSCLSTTGLFALFFCALLGASDWVLASVLFVTGVGFGSASMPFLLSAQHGVGWQQRGIVTSANQFFRTMGGAIGIGLLGMMFNVLAAPEMKRLHDMNIKPASIMDPHIAGTLPADAKEIVHSMIDHGLTWVFLAMAVVASCQIFFSYRMPRDNDRFTPEDSGTFETLPG